MLRIPKVSTVSVEEISEKISDKLDDHLEENRNDDLQAPLAEKAEAEEAVVSEKEVKTEESVEEEDAYEEDEERTFVKERKKKETKEKKKKAKKAKEEEAEEDLEEDEKKSGGRGIVREIIILAAVFLACLVIIPNFIMQRTIVNGDSMNETLISGDQLMVDKLTPHFKEYERFDVVVFYPFGKDASNEYYIKRIIGMPGETIQIVGDTIYIDGQELDEDYGKDPMTFAGIAAEPISLGENEYFLLGDNREISFDSRYEQVGVVHKNQIAGKAFVRIWPLSEFGNFDK
ncbi:MAG: signal peptidase I [Lachnospiraceae bacterium]|nr:signal peptidase I [Lachnospiraceae bacterium]